MSLRALRAECCAIEAGEAIFWIGQITSFAKEYQLTLCCILIAIQPNKTIPHTAIIPINTQPPNASKSPNLSNKIDPLITANNPSTAPISFPQCPFTKLV